ncbi:pathogen-associated molecular patterns-induced protein A70-like [Actinidia eriantha]|uniref:pathogen-associated molecular patterns-induced protein A70-like n=1 Tax=Actinidia eriantha TaxID=165200 RepID=UPI0025829D72|nr:pathogen-associated molecular patterns-induced protein A70-like [Actinidia eriantha]
MDGAGTMWASMASWFTPIILFCFLNVMIAILLLTSQLKSHNHKPTNDQQDPPQQARPMSILDRVKFIDFSLYRSDQPDPSQYEHNPHQLVRAPSILERVRSIAFSVYRSDQPDPPHNTPQLVRTPAMLDWVMSNVSTYRSEQSDPLQFEPHPVDPIQSEVEDHHVSRSMSETAPEGEAVVARMRKSASEKLRVAVVEAAAVDQRRPSTTRERNRTVSFVDDEGVDEKGDDEGVDGKADDFINKFKKQLKLQRLDSILKYNEMLNRGSCE